MESVVLYYQNRILRKRIAIEEIIQGRACVLEEARSQRSVRELVEEVIDKELAGAATSLPYLRKRCVELHPEMEHKIKRGIWQACTQLVQRGKSISLPHREQAPSEPQPLLVINGDMNHE